MSLEIKAYSPKDVADALVYRSFCYTVLKNPHLLQTASDWYPGGADMAKRFNNDYCLKHQERKQDLWSDGCSYCESCLYEAHHYGDEGLEDELIEEDGKQNGY